MIASTVPVRAPTCVPSASSRQPSAVVCRAAARPAAPQAERQSFLQKAAAAAAAGLLIAGPAMARPTDFIQTPPSANKPGQPATEDKLPTNPSNTGQPAGTDNKAEVAQQNQRPQDFSTKTQLSTSQQFEGKSPTAVGPNPDTAGEGGPGAKAFGNPFKSLGFGPGT